MWKENRSCGARMNVTPGAWEAHFLSLFRAESPPILQLDHPRRDYTRRGKRERRTRKEDGWNQDWTEDGTGWRKKKDLLGGSDRWM